MKEEIKEILELQNKIKSIENETYYLTYVEWKEILDYITNLQEENERLNKQYNLMEQLLDEKQEVIDKAIDYLYCVGEIIDGDIQHRLLNILQGEDK